MSEVQSDIDLTGLARKQSTLEPPRRSWMRILVPVGILASLALLLFSTDQEWWRSRVDVEVTRPRVVRGGPSGAAKGTVTVQAAGWVEPDPFPMHVPALTDGVVREVLVQESDSVQVGDVVALLVDDDARLDLDQAQAQLALAYGVLAEAEARSTIANERFDAALAVTEGEATARSILEEKESEALHRTAAVRQGHARVEIAASELVVQRELEEAGASGTRQVELAQAALEEAEGLLSVLEADASLARAEVKTARARLTRAVDELAKRFDDRLARDLGAASVTQAQAQVAEAGTAVAVAELELERMTIRSPVAGVVLERMVVPGTVLSVTRQDHAVCSLFDPASLRIRVDVPQADVERIAIGSQAEVVCESRPGRPYRGEVLRIVSQADIQKVTLQVHVRILDGDELIRPEMLAQVKFLAGEPAGAPAGEDLEASGVTRLQVPAELVEGGALWVLDPDGNRARLRTVQTGAKDGPDGAWVEIVDGLNATDKLITKGRSGLQDGTRVLVAGGGS